MITQLRESPYDMLLIDAPSFPGTPQRYYVEVLAGSLDEQSQLIEQVIRFAFDTLGVRHVDMRVRGADRQSIPVRTQLNT
jgi:hypothetical protein